MVKFWKIAPGPKARFWDECHKQQCTTINFMRGTNIKQLLKKFTSKEDRIKALQEELDEAYTVNANSILYFIDDVQPGDTVGLPYELWTLS